MKKFIKILSIIVVIIAILPSKCLPNSTNIAEDLGVALANNNYDKIREILDIYPDIIDSPNQLPVILSYIAMIDTNVSIYNDREAYIKFDENTFDLLLSYTSKLNYDFIINGQEITFVELASSLMTKNQNLSDEKIIKMMDKFIQKGMNIADYRPYGKVKILLSTSLKRPKYFDFLLENGAMIDTFLVDIVVHNFGEFSRRIPKNNQDENVALAVLNDEKYINTKKEFYLAMNKILNVRKIDEFVPVDIKLATYMFSKAHDDEALNFLYKKGVCNKKELCDTYKQEIAKYYPNFKIEE